MKKPEVKTGLHRRQHAGADQDVWGQLQGSRSGSSPTTSSATPSTERALEVGRGPSGGSSWRRGAREAHRARPGARAADRRPRSWRRRSPTTRTGSSSNFTPRGSTEEGGRGRARDGGADARRPQRGADAASARRRTSGTGARAPGRSCGRCSPTRRRGGWFARRTGAGDDPPQLLRRARRRARGGPTHQPAARPMGIQQGCGGRRAPQGRQRDRARHHVVHESGRACGHRGRVPARRCERQSQLGAGGRDDVRRPECGGQHPVDRAVPRHRHDAHRWRSGSAPSSGCPALQSRRGEPGGSKITSVGEVRQGLRVARADRRCDQPPREHRVRSWRRARTKTRLVHGQQRWSGPRPASSASRAAFACCSVRRASACRSRPWPR